MTRPAPLPPIERRHAIPDAVERVVAIGDVHGRADCLDALLTRIAASTKPERRTALVFLGDLVDRGPASREVMARVAQALARWPGSLVCLGNHDDWFRRFLLADPDFEDQLELWLMQGGEETLRSFGADPERPDEARTCILDRDPACLDLLQNAAMFATWNGFVFVHAGIDPHVPLDRQTSRTCLWVRTPFLDHRGPLPGIVLHGHTPQTPARAHVTENRISLDTGAFHTGVLTAAEIDAPAGTVRFWMSRHGAPACPAQPVLCDRGWGTVLRATKEDGSVFALTSDG